MVSPRSTSEVGEAVWLFGCHVCLYVFKSFLNPLGEIREIIDEEADSEPVYFVGELGVVYPGGY